MRIIAGQFRSRKLQSPPEDSPTRPLPDRVRESLFNLLRGHFDDAVVLDCFAGVGSFGLEALSRGARHAVMVERDRRVADVLRKNVATLKIEDRAEVVVGDALGPACLARCPTPIKIAFLDPPYALVRQPPGWDRVRSQMARIVPLLADDGYLIVRTPWPFVYTSETDASKPARVTPEEPREIVITDLEQLDDEALDEFEADLVGPDKPKPIDMDLAVAGAIGPETHEYKTTAVHLYMREPEVKL